ncbi:Alpha/Beta hydrolase protein [Staphylotrichum tortipilum]|uniref:Alpha/Beta hydrolase protein n=1 Tax=Staphylotrichum tortipilum TaxID=2831512 RepID=A0AAN6MKN8_9PEZI|nr:Alpha/Beta hydrolase protein [Staphylotrichum longicolle]
MHSSTFTTTDSCPLSFLTSLPLPPSTPSTPAYATCILLLHGFSGSSAYFTRNLPTLSSTRWVVAPDLRGHGRSAHNPSRGGFHVSRLAADLRELILHLGRSTGVPGIRFVPVGCSIGAAVVWTYVELFGEEGMRGYVFVDQAPLQDRAVLGLGGEWGAGLAHAGCFDEKSMLAAQEGWVREERREGTYKGLVRECLGYRFKPEEGDGVGEEEAGRDEEFFTGISRGCDSVWLARLLADHTRYDHREACEGLKKPVLVMAGRRSGCFTLEGMSETVERARKGGNEDAEMVVFDSGHWLFYEEPERFNRELLEFVERCTK